MSIDFLQQLPASFWMAVGALSLALAVSSVGIMPVLLAALPVDFVVVAPLPLGTRLALSSLSGKLVLLGRNLLGVLLLLLGFVMLFVPGQGLLTILVGLFLVDGPGRHRLAVWLLRKPVISRAVQRLRARRGAPPLHGLPPPAGPPPG